MVIIEMENGGIIKIETDRSAAPNTVDNFVHLASSGFYDGLTFHRVIKGFMIQGGDPDGTGSGGPGYHIKGEFRANGVQNPLKHKRGVISMARASDPDSAGSQFFIMHADSPHLDGQYAAFGHVTEGMEAVDEIASVPTCYGDRPKTAVRIKSMRVENEGEIKEPVKIKL
ncbi:MAG: Peptidyl-prolyl cis-trans isomerase A precursor [Firmicutes bacterium ADurb.Bin182]|nr:MAG: Peptidyl-prolyl cis-trans isomerase A precursor [Firmicutes bacterium ADurb.Bin182]